MQAAEVLLHSALHDEDQNVRYEASMLYMTHPHGKMMAPLNERYLYIHNFFITL